MRRFRIFTAAAVIAGAALALGGSPAGAANKNTCPPPPPPGSTVNGGLLVTAQCTLVDVTVNGGATVTSTGRLELERSTIRGGVDVQPGGELDSGHTSSSAVGTFLPSTIDGGVNSDHGIDIDLQNATVNGRTTIVGNAAGFSPTICKSTLNGSVTISDINSPNPFFPTIVGDPGEPIQAGPVPDCPGNTINGSLFVTNSRFLEIEGNSIDGSVFLDTSTIELAANNISGSVHCNNATFYTDGDPAPNNVGGSFDCP